MNEMYNNKMKQLNNYTYYNDIIKYDNHSRENKM